MRLIYFEIWFVFFMASCTAFAFGDGIKSKFCEKTNSKTASLSAIALNDCQQKKASPQCQNLYAEIKESGEDLASRSLRCEVDTESLGREKFAVAAIGCLRGGIYDRIIEPLKSLSRAIGTGAATVVVSWNEAEDRRKKCDAQPNQKIKLYEVYNQSVPQLLRIAVPTPA